MMTYYKGVLFKVMLPQIGHLKWATWYKILILSSAIVILKSVHF